jgi:dTDP-4-amino-4,6-dideoxygalactose transaminase
MTADTPAALGGVPVRAAKQYPRWPQWDQAERTGLLTVLDSGAWWSGDGNAAAAFANDFARYHSARFGLAVTNGTHTIEAALMACNIGDGDEVIVPAMTFVASASAVLAVNATPVIVDIESESLCIDVVAAERAITDRTRAIVAVYVAGAPPDLDALMELCNRKGLALIEDCAHAHGTFWRGQGAGSFGSFGSFSFQSSKLMTAGEGGALICNDDTLRTRAESYINCGRSADGHWYHHPNLGSNLRMTEWQGAVLAAQLERFPAQNATRNSNAMLLGTALGEVPGLHAQPRDPRMDSQGNYCFVWHYDDDAFAGMPLGIFEAAMHQEGIPLGVSYPSLNTLDLFRNANFGPRVRRSASTIDYANLHLPVAEHAAKSTVWMEHRVLLGEPEDVLDVARAAARIQRYAAQIAAVATS